MSFFSGLGGKIAAGAGALFGGAAGVGLPQIAAGLFGGAGDIYSAQQANRSAEGMANKQMDFSQAQARYQMDFNEAQSAKQMAFQERMSSTAHQREVSDLQAAGLNPLLSVNSGASSPSGSMASGASGSSAGYTPQQVPYGRAIASAMEMKSFMNEQKLFDKQLGILKNAEVAGRYDSELKAQDVEGSYYDNELLKKRNAYFDKHPNMFKLHLMSGGLSSAAGAARGFIPGADMLRFMKSGK